jgi:hypothetical protein
MSELITDYDRSCGGCTMCCQGWLYANIHEKMMYAGRPCHFVAENGCAIYINRPHSPCKTYKCVWLVDNSLPEWLKPSVSKVICTWRTISESTYLEVKECGVPLDSKVLSWLIGFHLNKKANVHYELHGGWNSLGDEDFLSAINPTPEPEADAQPEEIVERIERAEGQE